MLVVALVGGIAVYALCKIARRDFQCWIPTLGAKESPRTSVVAKWVCLLEALYNRRVQLECFLGYDPPLYDDCHLMGT